MTTTNFNKMTAEEQHEFLVNFLSGALYGSYWARAYMDDAVGDKYVKQGDCCKDVWAKALLAGESLGIIDREERKTMYDLTLKDIVEGYNLVTEHQPYVWARIAAAEGDADMWDYDAMLQYSLFGELIYG